MNIIRVSKSVLKNSASSADMAPISDSYLSLPNVEGSLILFFMAYPHTIYNMHETGFFKISFIFMPRFFL
ncbi:MAG: hypothetical protein DRI57_29005 [Deltaproteobacteria bacterium]|nr:MAG: hypothetical protein DRI57_29005 [Deltaproteobacteria bacterium]